MSVQRVHRGEPWWWESPYAGRRPVVVLSGNAALVRLKTAIVAPCTTNIRGLASEVLLEPDDDPVSTLSAINLALSKMLLKPCSPSAWST